MINVDDRLLDQINEKELYLLMRIAQHILKNPEKKQCFPGKNRLRKLTGYGRDKLNQTIKSLNDKGIIDKEQRKSKKGEFLTNLYTVKTQYIQIYVTQKLDLTFASSDEDHENVNPYTENQYTDKPYTDYPCTENPCTDYPATENQYTNVIKNHEGIKNHEDIKKEGNAFPSDFNEILNTENQERQEKEKSCAQKEKVSLAFIEEISEYFGIRKESITNKKRIKEKLIELSNRTNYEDWENGFEFFKHQYQAYRIYQFNTGVFKKSWKSFVLNDGYEEQDWQKNLKEYQAHKNAEAKKQNFLADLPKPTMADHVGQQQDVKFRKKKRVA